MSKEYTLKEIASTHGFNAFELERFVYMYIGDLEIDPEEIKVRDFEVHTFVSCFENHSKSKSQKTKKVIPPHKSEQKDKDYEQRESTKP